VCINIIFELQESVNNSPVLILSQNRMKNTNPLKPRILYVDDTEINLTLFDLTFKDEFEIFLADSGDKALELLRQYEFVVLITDQRMPGMSGNELLEIATEEFPDVTRFLLTAYSDYETLVEAINKGQIYGFFNKPFKANEVRMGLKKASELYYLKERNKQMVKELEIVNNELKTIDHSKTHFLNTITEEIKVPIEKIAGTIHMLKDKIDSKDLIELLNYLDSSIERLSSFSSMASQLAKLRDGMKLEFNKVSLKELIEVSIIEKNQEIRDGNIHVIIEECVDTLHTEGNFELLLSCLNILLSQSIKAAGSGNSIKMGLNRNHKGPFIKVNYKSTADTNKELSNLRNILDSGLRGIQSDARLELVLANQIMETHKGEISIDQNNDLTMFLQFKD
jgi:CheY-like chemotaxis protein